MPVRGFEPIRATEITAPKYGTGYRIGGRLLLTAAHLFPEGPGSPCRVRSRSASGEIEWEINAQVVWKAFEGDAALVKLPEKVEGIPAAVLGRIPSGTGATRVHYDMYGWPKWSQTIYPGSRPKAGGRHIPGEIFLADRSPEGYLVLEPEREPGVPMPGEKGSQWEGISGAAVVCDGLVVAVQHSHQRPNRPASLEAEPLSNFFKDESFRRLLAEHGISLSFPEVQTLKPIRGPEPPLELTRIPISARNLFNFRTQAIPLIGRSTELSKLHGFLNADLPFVWWLLTGKAGSGKSRLAFELCIQVEHDWRVGFLPSDHGFEHWRDWRPSRPTLVVIDHALARAKEVHRIIESLYDRKESLSYPVRLLLLERSGGSWLRNLYGAGSGQLKVESAEYDSALELDPLSQEQQWELFSELLNKWGAKELPKRETTLAALQHADPYNRPLFVALAAHSLSVGQDIRSMGGEELIADFLRNEQELVWVPAGVTERDKSLLALVTMVALIHDKDGEAGLSFPQTLRKLFESQAKEYLPEFAPGSAQQDLARYGVMTGIESPGQLQPLEPDLVGEYFVLEHLNPLVDPLGLRAQVLCAEAWRLNRIVFATFIHVAVSDFPDHPSIEILDRRWGDDPKDWFVWAGNLFFRMRDLTKQGKFDRILKDFRQILAVAPRPEERELDARSWLPLIVPDLVKIFGEVDRRADAEQVYEEYSHYLRDAGLKRESEATLGTVEYDLIFFACRAEDPSTCERLWPKLLERAQSSNDSETIAEAAYAASNFIVSFAEGRRESALTIFRNVSELLKAKRGTVSEAASLPTRLMGFWEVPLRCSSSLMVSCWKDEDVNSCLTTFVEAVRFLPAMPAKEESTSGMPPLDEVLEDLAKKGQALAEHLVEESRPQEVVQVLDSLWQIIGWVSDPETVITGLSIAYWKAIGIAVEADNIDLALRIHARLLQACKQRPDNFSLREATAGISTQLVASCAYHDRLDVAMDLFEELWTMVKDSVSSGNEADRNKVIYASFYLAHAQQQRGSRDEAKKIFARVLSVVPLRESLAYLHKTFGNEQVDNLLEQLGYALSKKGDVGES